uniref:WGS project CAEQ00000000 data, annotated contig 1459 n=1 Tax=Trypanosoma congolense (strain IL3000) TaxID=1068625 RepID=F9W6G0_TRYCI|nr:unnamed protein product [Trypanosoma congolense IL3000]
MAFLLLISSAAALFVALRRGISMAHSARGTFAGLLCVPNMGLMLWVELPKAYTEGHYTAVNYHLLSWMFILIGAYIGYSNFPEAQISQATRQWSKGANRRHTIGFRCWRWIGRYLLSRNDLDYTWNSHNIWHYCVMLGVVAKLFGCRYDVVEFELTRCTL